MEQVEPSQEATDMIALVKQVPICYRCRNGDFIELDDLEDLEDFGEMLDYYFDKNNVHPEVKIYGKWYKKGLLLFTRRQHGYILQKKVSLGRIGLKLLIPLLDIKLSWDLVHLL